MELYTHYTVESIIGKRIEFFVRYVYIPVCISCYLFKKKNVSTKQIFVALGKHPISHFNKVTANCTE